MCNIGTEMREVEFEPLAAAEPAPEPAQESSDERAPQRV